MIASKSDGLIAVNGATPVINCTVITSQASLGVLNIIEFVPESYVKSLVAPCLPYRLDSVLTHIHAAHAGVCTNGKSVCAAVASYSSMNACPEAIGLHVATNTNIYALSDAPNGVVKFIVCVNGL